MNAPTTPETKLAILEAGTEVARRAARPEAQSLIGQVRWPLLAEQLRGQRLLPLLGARIIEVAGDIAPSYFQTSVHEATESAAEQDAFAELITIQLLDALTGAEIPALALKGPILGRRLYGQPGQRPSGDIDLLVRREDLATAVRVAAEIGYLRDSACELPRLHLRLKHQHRRIPVLELHWRLHWYEADFSRCLLKRSVENNELGRQPRPADELVSLLLFYARDGFVGLRLACDIAAWWDRLGVRLEPLALERTIASHPALERVLVAAVAVAERVVGVPLASLIAPGRRLEPRVRLAARLVNPFGRGNRQQQIADTALVDWLLTPAGGHRDCVRRQLTDPGTVELAAHGTYSLGHGARLLRREAASLMRLARVPLT